MLGRMALISNGKYPMLNMPRSLVKILSEYLVDDILCDLL